MSVSVRLGRLLFKARSSICRDWSFELVVGGESVTAKTMLVKSPLSWRGGRMLRETVWFVTDQIEPILTSREGALGRV